jgi:hypothetical protein
MAKKSTNAEIQRRLKTIYTMLCINTSFTDIVAYCNRTWDVTPAIAKRYIKQATLQIRQEITADMNDIRAIAIAQYSDLFKRILSNKVSTDKILKDKDGNPVMIAGRNIIIDAQYETLTYKDKMDLLIKIRARMDKITGIETISITGKDGGPINIKELSESEVEKRIEQIEKILSVKI